MTERLPFWKPEPRKPWSDWRTYSMLIPIAISMLGFFVSGIFAFAFSDIDVIADTAQSWMVIVSSALIVFGAESNTPGTVIEVFRKLLRKEHNGWDVSALVLSLVGTIANLLITFASRTELTPVWRMALLNWGPLVAGFAVACDYYGGLVETGFLFGSFEMRMEAWLEEKRDYEGGPELPAPEPVQAQPNRVEIDPSWPEATIEDARDIFKGLNGERATWSSKQLKEYLVTELAERHLRRRSKSATSRWIQEAREG